MELTPEIISGYVAGTISSYQIAERLGISQPTVLKKLKEAGVDTSRNRTQEPKVIIPPEIIRSYSRKKIGMEDIAKTLGCSRGAVRKALHRAGVKGKRGGVTPSGRYTEGEQAKKHLGKLMRWLNRHGYRMQQLADIMGVSIRQAAEIKNY